MAVGPTLIVAVVAATAARRDGLGTAGALALGAALAAGLVVFVYFVAAERHTEVRVDERGVVRVDPFRRRGMAWDEVERIAYNGVSRWFFLAGPGGIRIWIPENMAGIGDFAEKALARIRPAVVSADEATEEALQQLVAEARQEDAAGKGTP
jgi:hypothetical protein